MATISVVDRPEGTYQITDKGLTASECKTILSRIVRYSVLINLLDKVVLTARGPNAYKLGQSALVKSQRAIPGKVVVKKSSNNDDYIIMFSLQRQEIDYRWNMDTHRWMLANNASTFGANQATLNPVVRGILDPAPSAGSRRAGPMINYITDSLFFQCDLCGDDHDEYKRAMKAAADIISSHQNNPNIPNIPYISLSWCTGDYNVKSVLDLVAGIPHLKEVTLIMHQHFRAMREDGEGLNCPARDDREAQGIIMSGDLNKWPFKAVILDYRKMDIEVDPDEFFD
jgi:hypothetical protein